MRASLVLVALLLAGCGGQPAAAPARVPVHAYQEAGDPVGLIDGSAGRIDTVGVDGVNLAPAGDEVGAPDADALGQLERAHRLGKRAVLLVGNFSSDLGDFDEETAYALLSDEGNLAAVAGRLTAYVREQGWDGIELDLESLRARDAAGLTDLARRLRTGLPAETTLGIAVMTYGTAQGYAAGGYDLAGLGAAVDRMTLMAYDQHGSADDPPGPVGALDWQAAGLDALLAAGVPAGKVDLGQAGYGLEWAPGAAGGARRVSDAAARSAAGGAATWDAAAGEWTATLPDGTVLWWADARSLAARSALVDSRRIHGLAVWSLGLSDPLS